MQPTVSLQVHALERGLDVRLFERRGPKIEATFEGHLLYEPAKPLVDGFGDLEATFRARRDTIESGRLRIGTGECEARHFCGWSAQAVP